MGAIYDSLDWATYKTQAKDHLRINGTDDDTLLEQLFNAAKRKADAYCNRPWKENIPQVTFASVQSGDSIAVDDIAFTAGTATDADARKFKVGVDDATDAAAFAALVNSTTIDGSYEIGLEDVIATASSGVVKLTKREPRAKDITVTSSDKTRLRVDYILTDETIPEEVFTWILEYMWHHYERRVSGIKMERASTGGTLHEYGAVDYSLIEHLRVNPGL